MKAKKIIFLPVFLCCFFKHSSGLNHSPDYGARSAGLSNASVTNRDLWSISNNQAGASNIRKIETGVSYLDRFLIPEISFKSVVVAIPSPPGVFGLTYSSFGYRNFNENQVGLSFSKGIGKLLSLGIKFDYLSTRIADIYGSSGTFTGEAGLIIQPLKNLYIGCHIFNPSFSEISKTNEEKIPSIFRSGLAYDFAGKVYFCLELEKDLSYNPRYKAGIEWKVTKNFFLRTGISSDPVENSFGLGVYLKNTKIDIACMTNQVAGISSGISISLGF